MALKILGNNVPCSYAAVVADDRGVNGPRTISGIQRTSVIPRLVSLRCIHRKKNVPKKCVDEVLLRDSGAVGRK